MFQDETFKNFDPEIIYIHISNENLKSLNNYDQTSEEKVKDEFIKLESIWHKLSQTLNVKLFKIILNHLLSRALVILMYLPNQALQEL